LDSKVIPLSISIGATLVHPGDDIRSLLDRADQQLYQSKLNGRGRASID